MIQDTDAVAPSPPGDGVSKLAVNDASTMLVAGAWDNSVTCYSIQQQQQRLALAPQAQIKHDAPVLCVDVVAGGNTVLSGGCDNVIKMWDPAQGTQSNNIGQHEKPVFFVKYIPDTKIIVSGSWDNTIKGWDARQPNPIFTHSIPERMLCMDVSHPAVVVGTADKLIRVFDMSSGSMRQMGEPAETRFGYQTRAVSIFADKKGFAVSCVEGRVGIQYFSQLGKTGNGTSNFAFKCHRAKRNDGSSDVFPVNVLTFNRYNTLLTGGSDGSMTVWCKDQRASVVSYPKYKGVLPVSAAVYNSQASMLFYALSYDWSMGVENKYTPMGSQILGHVCPTSETSKPPTNKKK
jgi:mRNA export factor